MHASELTGDNARRILADIVRVIKEDEDWNADTFSDIVDCLNFNPQGRLWPPDEDGQFDVI